MTKKKRLPPRMEEVKKNKDNNELQKYKTFCNNLKYYSSSIIICKVQLKLILVTIMIVLSMIVKKYIQTIKLYLK